MIPQAFSRTSADPGSADNGAADQGSLPPAMIRAYRDSGCVFPLTAMSPAQAGRYLERLEAFEGEWGSRASQVMRQKSHLALTWVADLVRLEPVLDAVQSLIGPDILCWSSSFFTKNAGDGRYVSWHQDSVYWGLEADSVVSAWIALTDSAVDNGCMRVALGSHRSLVPHHERPRADNMLTHGQEVSVRVDEADATDVLLSPGQFSLHHEHIIHGSNPNRSARRRIGLAVRYTIPASRQVVESADSATLVRGRDDRGHFAHEPRPPRDMDPASLDYLDALLSRRAGGVYRSGE